jgi:hypothetical protein
MEFIIIEVNGFDAIFTGGTHIINPFTNLSCYISLKITFYCDPLVYWEIGDEKEPGNAPAKSKFTTISASSCEVSINN